jgi:hypothetical protein
LPQRKLSARHERLIFPAQRHGYAHGVHAILDRDLDADVVALARPDHVERAQANRRIVSSVEQRGRQQVVASAVARVLRYRVREVGARLLAHRGLVDGELAHGEAQVETRAQRILRHIDRSFQVVGCDHVVVAELRHRAATIDEDLQARFPSLHAIFDRIGRYRKYARHRRIRGIRGWRTCLAGGEPQ